MLCCWATILFWLISFHSQIRATSPSLPRSCRVFPSSSKSLFSTTAWVAIPAWSVPGSQRVLSPIMRCHRIRRSCITLSMACPMCRAPVTLGRGIMMTKRFSLSSGKAAKALARSHFWVTASWKAAGSYCLGSSLDISGGPLGKDGRARKGAQCPGPTRASQPWERGKPGAPGERFPLPLRPKKVFLSIPLGPAGPFAGFPDLKQGGALP